MSVIYIIRASVKLDAMQDKEMTRVICNIQTFQSVVLKCQWQHFFSFFPKVNQTDTCMISFSVAVTMLNDVPSVL